MNEFHLTIRSGDLAASIDFYSWMFGLPPKSMFENRYATFLVPDINLNLVIIQSDEVDETDRRIHHLGVSVPGKDAVIAFQDRAMADGRTVSTPARTTWRGTAMHQLWLQDPDGLKIEIYARLTEDELAEAPDDLEPVDLRA